MPPHDSRRRQTPFWASPDPLVNLQTFFLVVQIDLPLCSPLRDPVKIHLSLASQFNLNCPSFDCLYGMTYGSDAQPRRLRTTVAAQPQRQHHRAYKQSRGRQIVSFAGNASSIANTSLQEENIVSQICRLGEMVMPVIPGNMTPIAPLECVFD